MGVSKLLVLILLSCIFIHFRKHENERDYIVWDNERRLGADDFKGVPDSSSRFSAISYVGPDISFHMIGDEYYVDSVRTIFYKQESWIKKDDVSNQLLEHENLHFDIAELYVRKLREKYDSLENIGVTDQRVYNYMTDKIMKERERFDIQFDTETKFGQYFLNQEAWKKKIEKELDDYAHYSFELEDL